MHRRAVMWLALVARPQPDTREDYQGRFGATDLPERQWRRGRDTRRRRGHSDAPGASIRPESTLSVTFWRLHF